ncbi:MAG: hypothetical protein Q8935_13755 [Bacillota bacterium]|nr:hypothetical protein [Bacillota bacterium]
MNEKDSKNLSFQVENGTNEHKLEMNYRYFTKTPKSKICFSILVHNDRELVKELIHNIRYFCPNSTFVLFNGGDDPSLCNDLGVPVCPTSRKLSYGFTTIYFLETMEWIEELGIDYDYFVNIDSDALFIKDGYENVIANEMRDVDYMAVLLRIPEPNWQIGLYLRKDIDRWRKLFSLDPYYGVFNVGQVIKRPLVKALLEPGKKETYKKTLSETISHGSDEIFYVNMAKELGFKMKKYPFVDDSVINRYRPHFTLGEIIDSINNKEFSGLCHPIYRYPGNPARKLIRHLAYNCMIEKYRHKNYPWYESDELNYAPSLPIVSKFGNQEIIVRSGNTLAHYWEHRRTKSWDKTEAFAKGVKGVPIFHSNPTRDFEVVCMLENGGIGYWWRENTANGFPWHGPYLIVQENAEPVMLDQLDDERNILVCKLNGKLVYWVGSKDKKWVKEAPLQ